MEAAALAAAKGHPEGGRAMETSREERLAALHDGIRVCTRCRLHETRRRPVPGEGPADARCMFIGEAPGAREDECGRPFVGMSGRFLDGLLAEGGLSREAIYITSVAKCRPPKNRNPRADETGSCIPAWLHDQIALIDPQIVVILGAVAFKALFGENVRMREVHGQVRESDGRKWLITYHPASAMRFPEPREGMREDFRLLAEMLATPDAPPGGPSSAAANYPRVCSPASEEEDAP